MNREDDFVWKKYLLRLKSENLRLKKGKKTCMKNFVKLPKKAVTLNSTHKQLIVSPTNVNLRQSMTQSTFPS